MKYLKLWSPILQGLLAPKDGAKLGKKGNIDDRGPRNIVFVLCCGAVRRRRPRSVVVSLSSVDGFSALLTVLHC
ncbi:hypothetical protein E2C01_066830 [Portunus trituberculatus]|uniref:Uncharacterized protein n=1 Tax=Portunus trituberculatus TaxID=210409 RepID=A0A5B7HJ83_PORTR|nr:hypothetical protein [Portunus trituberculatus]